MSFFGHYLAMRKNSRIFSYLVYPAFLPLILRLHAATALLMLNESFNIHP